MISRRAGSRGGLFCPPRDPLRDIDENRENQQAFGRFLHTCSCGRRPRKRRCRDGRPSRAGRFFRSQSSDPVRTCVWSQTPVVLIRVDSEN